jgi:predicted methyltransferase
MSVPQWQKVPVLSGRTARKLLDCRSGSLEASLDLGRTRCVVQVEDEELVLADGQRLEKARLAEEFSEPEDCIEVREGRPRKVYHYDEQRRSYYKLFQSHPDRPPTILINGATMHPVSGTDPWEGTREMVAQLPKCGGQCLDTCCGLGYSAQMLSERGFDAVVTCEVDANVLRVAAVNPWSEGLFASGRIDVLHADLREVVADSPEGRFGCIFHDPPTVYQAGELYAGELYGEFRRVLTSRGILYHYVGSPGGRLGQDYAHGVIQRLQEAGFYRVRRVSGGVLARRRPAT